MGCAESRTAPEPDDESDLPLKKSSYSASELRRSIVSINKDHDINTVYDCDTGSRVMGSGATATVKTIRHRKTGVEYALKSIRLNRMDSKFNVPGCCLFVCSVCLFCVCHPISSNLIQSHPTSSNLIQPHPISSNLLVPNFCTCMYVPMFHVPGCCFLFVLFLYLVGLFVIQSSDPHRALHCSQLRNQKKRKRCCWLKSISCDKWTIRTLLKSLPLTCPFKCCTLLWNCVPEGNCLTSFTNKKIVNFRK
jgi:hypothetical protein